MASTTTSTNSISIGGPGLTLFAYGFRPLFLLAGLQAALALPVWLGLYAGGLGLPTVFPPSVWHAHEMLYGFATAVLAGFFLTAVPNWTGAPHLRGWPLAALAGLWLAGRALVWLSALVPEPLVAAVDLAFVPALALAVAPHLLAPGATRQRIFMVLLALLFCGNLLVHLPWLGGEGVEPRLGLYLGLDVFVLLLTVMGGRIVPSFTANILRRDGRALDLRSSPLIERATLALTGLLIPLELFLGDDRIVGAAALAAAAAHFLRLAGWHSWQARREPILWVLHVGYLWIPLGLALRGLFLAFDLVPANAGVHALTVGAIGTMTLGVMSRAALGHTGRPLKAAPLTVAAYGLVTFAAVVRVLGALCAPDALYGLTVDFSGTAWTLGWVLFVAVYAPMLVRPRADGKPG
jgi:uncharacterized protein involved in response to NO